MEQAMYDGVERSTYSDWKRSFLENGKPQALTAESLEAAFYKARLEEPHPPEPDIFLPEEYAKIVAWAATTGQDLSLIRRTDFWFWICEQRNKNGIRWNFTPDGKL